MASKKTAKTPAVRYLRYELTNSGTPGTETSHFIDIAKDLSAVNRRLYRQGRRYHVKKVTIVSRNTNAITPGVDAASSAGFISASCAPESWITQQAWHRGFKLWQQMQKKALTGTASDLRGTWNDFKVYLTSTHATSSMLTPKDNGGNNLKLGDWSYSDFISPDGTTTTDEFYACLLGDHVGSVGSYTSIGLVKSYGESRATVSQRPTPDTGAVDSDDPLINLFDDGTHMDEIIEKMQTDGEDPPYDIDEYPGDDGNMPKPIVVQHTTLGTDGRATLSGFEAMCGLVEFEASSPIANDVYSVLVELAPGSFRGVKAEVI